MLQIIMWQRKKLNSVSNLAKGIVSQTLICYAFTAEKNHILSKLQWNCILTC
jgi:hypothetical protein